MAEETTFYRRNFPHIRPKDGTFFITFRLAGSLPKHIIERLRRCRQTELKKLAKTTPPKRLEREKYNLENLDGERYHLRVYCIMSNHVHLVIDQSRFQKMAASNKHGRTRNYALADTLRILKGSTSYTGLNINVELQVRISRT